MHHVIDVITDLLHSITCFPSHYMHYMLCYMLIACSIIYYRLHYMPTTWSITCHYMQHHPITCSITCQLHDQLHDSLHVITCSTIPLHVPLHDNCIINYMIHYLLNYLPLYAWHEISWAHDHVFLAPPSTPKKSPSLSASGAQDRRRRLRRLMRGLLERSLLSCPKHENTGLESVRIIKAPHLFSGQLWATAKFIELGTPSHSKINRAWNSKPQRN